VTRITFDLLAEPLDDLYAGILDSALAECRLALLVLQRPPAAESQARLRQFQPFLLRITESGEWPGNKMLPPHTAQLLWYDYRPECAELMKQAADRLYGWTQWDHPEDLCLFQDEDDLWLGTITHEHDGWFCLSTEEKARLVEALPRLGPMLRDARRRDEYQAPALEVQRLLSSWDGYEYLRDDPSQDYTQGWYGQEAQAVLYALRSGEAGNVVELAQYTAAMFSRWMPDEYAAITAWDLIDPAQAIWEWWHEEQGR
jgi:hypothetical protein